VVISVEILALGRRRGKSREVWGWFKDLLCVVSATLCGEFVGKVDNTAEGAEDRRDYAEIKPGLFNINSATRKAGVRVDNMAFYFLLIPDIDLRVKRFAVLFAALGLHLLIGVLFYIDDPTGMAAASGGSLISFFALLLVSMSLLVFVSARKSQ
jgi:hypothetical protein